MLISMREIKLTKGLTALVDCDDFELVSQYSWHCNGSNAKHPYAVRRINRAECEKHFDVIYNNERRPIMHMSRLVLGVPYKIGMDKKNIIHHINGNTLDNRKTNLKKVTQSENLRNNNKIREIIMSSFKDGFSTIEDAAKELGLTKTTLYAWKREGIIEFKRGISTDARGKIRRRTVVDISELVKILKNERSIYLLPSLKD